MQSIGKGVVSDAGFEYFLDGKVQSAYCGGLLSAVELAKTLISNGNGNLRPAYKADVKLSDGTLKEVFLSVFHTKRVFGEAPRLSPNDRVEVFAAENEKSKSGMCYVFKKG